MRVGQHQPQQRHHKERPQRCIQKRPDMNQPRIPPYRGPRSGDGQGGNLQQDYEWYLSKKVTNFGLRDLKTKAEQVSHSEREKEDRQIERYQDAGDKGPALSGCIQVRNHPPPVFSFYSTLRLHYSPSSSTPSPP